MTDVLPGGIEDVTRDTKIELQTSTIRNPEVSKNAEEVDDEDDDDEGDDGEGDENQVGNADKKKKKKKKGKKKKKPAVIGTKLPLSRCLLGFTDSYLKYGQSDPPTKYVADLFPLGQYEAITEIYLSIAYHCMLSLKLEVVLCPNFKTVTFTSFILLFDKLFDHNFS